MFPIIPTAIAIGSAALEASNDPLSEEKQAAINKQNQKNSATLDNQVDTRLSWLKSSLLEQSAGARKNKAKNNLKSGFEAIKKKKFKDIEKLKITQLTKGKVDEGTGSRQKTSGLNKARLIAQQRHEKSLPMMQYLTDTHPFLTQKIKEQKNEFEAAYRYKRLLGITPPAELIPQESTFKRLARIGIAGAKGFAGAKTGLSEAGDFEALGKYIPEGPLRTGLTITS